MTEEKIYTIVELAALLDISPEVLRRRIKNKEIRAYKQMNKWFIRHQDYVSYVVDRGTPNM